jgi:hypothetical protein
MRLDNQTIYYGEFVKNLFNGKGLILKKRPIGKLNSNLNESLVQENNSKFD